MVLLRPTSRVTALTTVCTGSTSCRGSQPRWISPFLRPLLGCFLRGAWPAGEPSAAGSTPFGSRVALQRAHLHGVVAPNIGFVRRWDPFRSGATPPEVCEPVIALSVNGGAAIHQLRRSRRVLCSPTNSPLGNGPFGTGGLAPLLGPRSTPRDPQPRLKPPSSTTEGSGCAQLLHYQPPQVLLLLIGRGNEAEPHPQLIVRTT